jgi:hypothetical protein
MNKDLQFHVFSGVISAIPVGNRFSHGIVRFLFQPNEKFAETGKIIISIRYNLDGYGEQAKTIIRLPEPIA